RRCLLQLLERVQDEVDVELPAHDPEGDACRSAAQETAGGREVDDVSAEGEPRRRAHGEEVAERQVRVVEAGRQGVRGDASSRRLKPPGKPLTDESVAARTAEGRGAPGDPEGEEVSPVQLVQPRLDFHLRERDVELLADELLDSLEIRLVVSD